MRLKGKRALVTGSSRGIGASIARTFAAEGATVAVNYRSSDSDALAVVRSITDAGGSAFAIGSDVSDPASVETMFAFIKERMGSLDILVNNAGLANEQIWNAPLGEITVDMWRTVASVDLIGTFLCTQKALPLMARNGGRVINIASTPVLTGDQVGLVYSAVKGSILALTKSLARTLAPAITVNCMILGSIDTTWVNWLTKKQVAEFKRAIPLGRFGSPDEVARVALFFAGEDSSFVTGQSLVVDGGEVMD